MTDKVLCPWCGAEMHHCSIKRTYDWEGHEMCGKCGATSPKRWAISQDAVRTQSEAAALRRYTPPIKPMTVEEIKQVRYEETAFWIEFAGTYKKEPACHWYLWSGLLGYSAMVVGYCEPWFLPVADYGKTWRCWERKPTDEERSAAEWETSRRE